MNHSLRNDLTRRAVTWRKLWIGFWILCAILTHLPPPVVPGLPRPWLDKVIHFLLFLILALLGGRGRRRNHSLDPGLALFWAAIYMVYAAIDEITQPLIGRHASLADWTADSFGVVVATALILGLRQRQPPLEGHS